MRTIDIKEIGNNDNQDRLFSIIVDDELIFNILVKEENNVAKIKINANDKNKSIFTGLYGAILLNEILQYVLNETEIPRTEIVFSNYFEPTLNVVRNFGIEKDENKSTESVKCYYKVR